MSENKLLYVYGFTPSRAIFKISRNLLTSKSFFVTLIFAKMSQNFLKSFSKAGVSSLQQVDFKCARHSYYKVKWLSAF